MGRKSQLYSIREIFQFTFGLLLLSSVVYLFYSIIIPEAREYAFNYEGYNLNSHLNYLISSGLKVLNKTHTSSTIITYSMPKEIGGYGYSMYFSNNNICTIFHSSSIVVCSDYGYSDLDLSGYFVSGGELRLNISKDGDSFSILMSN